MSGSCQNQTYAVQQIRDAIRLLRRRWQAGMAAPLRSQIALTDECRHRSISAMIASSFASFCIVFTVETRVVFGQHVLEK